MIELDGRRLQRCEDGHLYMKEKLQFMEDYGCNLDALFDALTEWSSEEEIRIYDSECMDERIKTVFLDAVNENKDLIIVLTNGTAMR